MSIPTIRKIHDPKVTALIDDLAKEDGDNMRLASHAVYKNGEIVGGWNIGQLPLALCWHHSEKVTARDSLVLNSVVDSMMDAMNVKAWWMACNSHSPYYRHVEKLGFQHMWPTNMILKELKNV